MKLVLSKDSTLFYAWAVLFVACGAYAVYQEEPAWLMLPFGALIFYSGWSDIRPVFFLLLFSLPFSFEYHFSEQLGTDVPDEFLMMLITLLMAARLCWHQRDIPRQVLVHPLLFLLALSFLWMTITVIFSSNPLVSAKFLLAKGWYIGAFVLATIMIGSERKDLFIGIILLALAMLAVTLIILGKHVQTGFSFESVNTAVSPFFRNHVNYSAMLVCMIPVFIAMLLLIKTRWIRIMLICIIAILLAALFLSYARGAWLALLTGILAAWLIKRKWLVPVFIIACISALAGIAWLEQDDRYVRYAHDYQTTIFHKEFKEHLVATYQLKDVSTAERFYRWIAGVRMIKDNGLTGYGPNTFYDHYKEYAIPAFRTWVSDNKEHSTVHNYFLLTAIEQGIPGLLLFVVLTAALFYYAQRIYQNATDRVDQIVARTTGVILAMIITLNTLSDLVETDKIGSLFFLCLSVLVIIDIRLTKKG